MQHLSIFCREWVPLRLSFAVLPDLRVVHRVQMQSVMARAIPHFEKIGVKKRLHNEFDMGAVQTKVAMEKFHIV
jgi:hypothetical protein